MGAAYTQLIWNPGSALEPACRELEGIRGKLAVVRRQIAEIQAQEKQNGRFRYREAPRDLERY